MKFNEKKKWVGEYDIKISGWYKWVINMIKEYKLIDKIKRMRMRP